MTREEVRKLAEGFLGKTVDIQIDRPVGYEHHGISYPVNYGYIPGTVGGDGEEVDVYILGVDQAVSRCRARIIGIVYRHNDCEDKLIAAPEGMSFTRDEMETAVRFQEQFFDITLFSFAEV